MRPFANSLRSLRFISLGKKKHPQITQIPQNETQKAETAKDAKTTQSYAKTGGMTAAVKCMGLQNTIAITGSRDVDRETAQALFEQHLSSFLSQGRTWLLGGSRGVDQWAIEWLLEQNETCWIVVPYTRGHQPKWLHPWFEQVERVIELRLPKRKNAHAIRNRHMVDLSQIVFGFWSGKGGSTVKTLKHALRKRREVHAIPVFLNADDM